MPTTWMRSRFLLPSIVALFAVASTSAAQGVAPQSQERAVYAALLDSLNPKPLPDTLLLGDSTLSFASAGGVREWRVQFDSIPADLPRQLTAASRARRPSRDLPLPRPVRVLTRAELADIFSGGPSGWTEFYRRYPAQRRYMRFSPVVFSADSLDALVYYEYHCGGLCGGGDAVWMRHASPAAPWLIRKRVRFWVS